VRIVHIMSDAVITVKNLSKSYLIGHQSAQLDRHQTFREAIERSVHNFTRMASDLARGRQIVQGDEIEEFWALTDVNFEVRRGEVLGIIGRNGSGKSTLLKILSRITKPTSGRIEIAGRVASLLEVGTGFHPELSGRENIYLNGSILGMTRSEIRRKFDEIVAFSEVEEFIDTPVKRYSSGMYVRLAFAVAAHLEPEILVVDEVLAVGDAEFQKKCLGKMSDVARQNRTVLFVSHSTGAIRVLAHRCILMEHGRIAASGDTETVLTAYLAQASDAAESAHGTRDLAHFRRFEKDDPEAKIVGIKTTSLSDDTNGVNTIALGSAFTIEIQLAVYKALTGANIGILIKSPQGEVVTAFASWDYSFRLSLDPGNRTVRINIFDLPLAPGRYLLDVSIDPVGDASCDVIYDYPLVSVVNRGQITYWLGRPWGSVQCRRVEWNAA
jgi:lipopolysaccharide transport system ATP-binding protein